MPTKVFSKNHSSFSMIELIVVIVLIAVVVAFSVPKKQISNLDLAVDRLVLYLHYVRYIGFLDNKFDIEDTEWKKKRWSLKFQRCSKSEDGLYFVVFSDESGGTAAFKKVETMKDPLNGKYLYSGYDCDPSYNESKNVLLTKEYGIKDVEISCNTTSTIGQLSFGYDGKIYSSLGTNIKEITDPCIISLEDKNGKKKEIELIPRSGFIHKV